MENKITTKSEKGRDITYIVKYEDRRFVLYALFDKEYEISSGISLENGKCYNVVNSKELQNFLGIKNTKDNNVYLPIVDISEVKESVRKEKINNNEIINVSWLDIHDDPIVDFGLECNLSKDEMKPFYKNYSNGISYYEIPAKNLVVERKPLQEFKEICVNCQKEYNFIENNGQCPHCGI